MIPLLDKTVEFVLSIITKNEKVKAFPNDFIDASMDWIRSWFLIDDPNTEVKLKDENRSVESKKTIIELKMDDLQKNNQFSRELAEKLADFEKHKNEAGISISDSFVQNAIMNSTVTVGGNFTQGNNNYK